MLSCGKVWRRGETRGEKGKPGVAMVAQVDREVHLTKSGSRAERRHVIRGRGKKDTTAF